MYWDVKCMNWKCPGLPQHISDSQSDRGFILGRLHTIEHYRSQIVCRFHMLRSHVFVRDALPYVSFVNNARTTHCYDI